MRAVLLDFDGTADRWEGTAGNLIIWMEDRTFQYHVQQYLQAQGLFQPTCDDRAEAVQSCRRLDRWLTCKDANVHIRRVGS